MTVGLAAMTGAARGAAFRPNRLLNARPEAMSHVFISYSRSDQRHGARVDDFLRGAGFRTWRDVRDMNPDADFTGELEAQIESASHFVVCVTADVASRRSFVRREIAYALAVEELRRRATPGRSLPIIPMVFPGGALPIHIATWTRIDVPDDEHDGQAMEELVRRLRGAAPEAPPAAGNVVDRYLHDLHDRITGLLRRTVHTLIEMHADSHDEVVMRPLDDFPVSPVMDAGSTTGARPRGPGASSLRALSETYPRLLLLGSPGGGKTTALLAMARSAAAERRLDERAPVPLVVHLAGWSGERPLMPWLHRKAGVPSSLTGVPSVYFLDGLDEVTDFQSERGHSARQLELLRAIEADLGSAPLVLSCRTDDFKAIGHRARLDGAVRLLPLPNAEIERYLRAHGLGSLWSAASRDGELLALLQTPLLLAVATIAWKDAGPTAANTEVSLFDHFVRGRFQHERSRKLPLLFDEETTRRRLGDRAVGIDMLSRDDKSFAQRALDASDKAFLAFSEHMHFLQTGVSGRLGFLHRKLEDFFALPVLDDLSARPLRPRAARWIHASAVRIGASAAPVIQRELWHDDEVRSWSAIKALTETLDPWTVPLLLAVSGRAGYVGSVADSALTGIGAEGLPPLEKVIAGESHPLAAAAIERLVNIGAPAVPLLRRLVEDVRPEIRARALTALGNLRHAKSMPHVEIHLNDESPVVRGEALRAFVALADATRATAAADRALDDASPIVRALAAALFRTPPLAAEAAAGDRVRLVQRLSAMLNTDVAAAASEAAQTLALVGDREGDTWLAACPVPRWIELRAVLVPALADSPTPALVGSIANLLISSPALPTRETVASALREISGRYLYECRKREDLAIMIPALAAALVRDVSEAVRADAARVLEHVATAVYYAPLGGAQTEPWSAGLTIDQVASAAGALARAFLVDASERVRASAASALDVFGRWISFSRRWPIEGVGVSPFCDAAADALGRAFLESREHASHRDAWRPPCADSEDGWEYALGMRVDDRVFWLLSVEGSRVSGQPPERSTHDG